jgi:hypothetical protein
MTFKREKNSIIAHSRGVSWEIVGTSLDKKMGLVEINFRGICHRNYFIRLDDLKPYRKLSKYPTFSHIGGTANVS